MDRECFFGAGILQSFTKTTKTQSSNKVWNGIEFILQDEIGVLWYLKSFVS